MTYHAFTKDEIIQDNYFVLKYKLDIKLYSLRCLLSISDYTHISYSSHFIKVIVSKLIVTSLISLTIRNLPIDYTIVFHQYLIWKHIINRK